MTPRPRFAPRYGAPGYERVGFCLLAAMTPVGLADDYNRRRGRLWVRCHALRTLPSSNEFADETEALRDMLYVVWNARASDHAAHRGLLTAAQWLSNAQREAEAVGLVK